MDNSTVVERIMAMLDRQLARCVQGIILCGKEPSFIFLGEYEYDKLRMAWGTTEHITRMLCRDVSPTDQVLHYRGIPVIPITYLHFVHVSFS